MKLTFIGTESTALSAHGESEPSDVARLKPCPFCGSKQVIIGNTHTPHYSAYCENCGAEGPGSLPFGRHAKTKTGLKAQHRKAFVQAMNNWNTRKP